MLKYIFLMIIGGVFFVSCGQCNASAAADDEIRAPEESEKVEIIDEAKVEELLSRNDVLFIDNRPSSMFKEGHLKGAVNMPYFAEGMPGNEMTQTALKKAAQEKSILVFYCTGRLRAQNALLQARKWGITNQMYWYKNGYSRWSSLGKEIVKPLNQN